MAVVTAAAAVCAALCVVAALGPRPAVTRLAAVIRGVDRPAEAAWNRRASWASFGPLGTAPAAPGAAGKPRWPHRGRIVAAALTATAGWLLVGGVGGMIVASGFAAAAWFGLGRFSPGAQIRDRERVVAALPLAADLLGEAMAAGCPPVRAVKVIGQAIGGPLGRVMLDVAASSAVGADPARAWAFLSDEPAARPLVRALVAATTRGAAPGPVLRRLACDARDAARWAGEARARSLGARAAAPLGLCFLPAFVLLGVVPVVAATGWLLP